MSIINKEENVAMVMKESRILTFYISTAAVQVLINKKNIVTLLHSKARISINNTKTLTKK